jgi:hypothetical protein
LDKRLLAFVGTADEKAATLIAPYSAFFQFTDASKTAVQLYIPQDTTAPADIWPLTPNAWIAVDTPFDQVFITEWLTPAGGLANGLYAFQRGNEADADKAFKHPGLPYFAKDINSLLIYSDVEQKWINVTGVPLATIVIYPNFLPVPASYLRCDGSFVPIATYKKLYTYIGDSFNYGIVPTGMFTLPTQDNAIVRYA